MSTHDTAAALNARPGKTHEPTSGQTIGPFFAFGLNYPKMHEVAFPHSPGALVLEGRV